MTRKSRSFRGLVLLEDTLWRALDEPFPDQLNPLQVGTSINQEAAGMPAW
jgi:hypothetical protein